MSQFTSNFKGELVGKNLWKNLEAFEYHIGSYPSDEIINVPVGFVTNFASIPRIFWSIISPIDTHGKAAVIHDYCYTYAPYNREKCDLIFYEALIVLKVEPWKIWFMYNFIRMFGCYQWDKDRETQNKI